MFTDMVPQANNARFERFEKALRARAVRELPPLRYLELREDMTEAQRRAALRALDADPIRLIVSANVQVALDWKANESRTPLIFPTLADPFDLGFVAPDGTKRLEATGLMVAGEPIAKQLELLREWAGPPRRLGLLADRYWVASSRGQRAMKLIEEATGGKPVLRIVDDREELGRVLSALSPATADAWLVVAVPTALLHPGLVVERFRAIGRPAVYANLAFVDAGAVLSFEARVNDVAGRMAALATEVLAGTPARLIPFEGPNEHRLAVNVAAAERSPVPLPAKILRRAHLFR